MKSNYSVVSKSIKTTSLHEPLTLFWHSYVWPFLVIAYPLWLSLFFYFQGINSAVHVEIRSEPESVVPLFSSTEILSLCLGALFLLQLLVFLSTHWSVALKARFTMKTVCFNPNSFNNFLIGLRPFECQIH